jgi:hypothetical protein
VCLFRQTLTLNTGAVSVASFADGEQLCAYKVNNGHVGVGINAYLGENPMNFAGPFGHVIVNAGRWLNGCVPVPVSAVSRKVHGAAGTFDINLPLVTIGGPVGIECRTGAVSGAHQMVVTFANPVTVGGASVTSGVGSASFSVAGAVVTINLTGVTNAQRLGVTLTNVNDGLGIGDVTVPMGVLAGDTTANGSVNASDVTQIKIQSGQPVTASNFRTDVTTNGSINASDISSVKLRSGTALP